MYSRILDIGCGYGDQALEIIREESPSPYVIVDVSQKLLCHTSDFTLRGVPRVFFIRADAQDLPLSNEIFDAVICSEVIEHLPDDLKALREVARVLKPGGTCIISTPHEGKPEINLGHLRHYNRESFLALVDAARLTPEVLIWGLASQNLSGSIPRKF